MYEIKAIIRRERLDDVVNALHEIPDAPGLTVSVVRGIGKQEGADSSRDVAYGETEMAKLETVVPEELRDAVISTVQQAARTGRAGDGKIFVARIEDAIKIRSGHHGLQAL